MVPVVVVTGCHTSLNTGRRSISYSLETPLAAVQFNCTPRVGEMIAAGDSEITLPAPTDQGFDDIGGLDAEFRDAINGLAAMGVVQGTTASRFDPFAPVRRDQMASFINRMQGALQALKGGDPEGFTTGADLFPDVTQANVHDDNVEAIASVGIVQGRNDGRYHPEVTVNRGQMAAFVMRWVAVIDAAGGIPGESTEEPTCDPTDDDCTEEPTEEPTLAPPTHMLCDLLGGLLCL